MNVLRKIYKIKMKKILLLGLVLVACSKQEYKYDSKINYSLYSKAYVFEIYNEVRSLYYIEKDEMEYFCSELDRKSGFVEVYNYFYPPNLPDSVINTAKGLPSEYLSFKLNVTAGSYKYKEINHDNGDVTFYYEAHITVLCETYDNKGLVYRVERTAEYDHEYDYDSEDNFDEVKVTALEKALKDIANYFTKSYVI
jgi:hypothetical protein